MALPSTVHVGNLSYRTTSEGLKEHFMAHGFYVLGAEVLMSPARGPGRPMSRGCGMVELFSHVEARRAMTQLTDTVVDGRLIFVREDREKPGFHNRLQLNTEITSARSSNEVLGLVGARLSEFDKVNTILAFYQVAKLQSHQRETQSHHYNALLSKLAETVALAASSMSFKDVANITWSFATLSDRNFPMMNAVLTALSEDDVRNVDSATPQSLVSIAWAAAKVQWSNSRLTEVLTEGAMRSVARFNGQDLSMTTWSFKTLALSDNKLWNSFAEETIAKLDVFTPRDVSLTAWSYAAMELQNGKLFAHLGSRSAQTCSEFSAQALAMTCWSYARVLLVTAEVDAAIRSESILKLSQFAPVDLANTTWAFATLGCVDMPLLEGLGAHTAARLPELSALDLSNSSRAFATLSSLHGSSGTTLLKGIAREAVCKMSEFSPQSLACFAWACKLRGLSEVEVDFDAVASNFINASENASVLSWCEAANALPHDPTDSSLALAACREVKAKFDTRIFLPALQQLQHLATPGAQAREGNTLEDDFQAFMDSAMLPNLGMTYCQRALLSLRINEPHGDFLARARSKVLDLFGEWRRPSTGNVAAYVEAEIGSICWDGKLFMCSAPASIAEPLLQAFPDRSMCKRDGYTERSDHAELAALLELSRQLVTAEQEPEQEPQPSSGIVRLYVSHFPCMSCTGVFCQFIRLFPSVTLEVGYDDAWKMWLEALDNGESALSTSIVGPLSGADWWECSAAFVGGEVHTAADTSARQHCTEGVLDGGHRVYVGNLAYRTSWQDLKDHFAKAIGNVMHTEILMEPCGKGPSSIRGRPISKGCGFVTFSTAEAAQRAISEMTDSSLDGRPIFVREDREAGCTDRGSSSNSQLGLAAGTETKMLERSNTDAQTSRDSNLACKDRNAKTHDDDGAEKHRVYVGNLSFRTSSLDLQNHFETLGRTCRAEVTIDDSRPGFASGRPVSKGYGFVEFDTSEGAERAIAEMTDTVLNGRKIFVREDREPAQPRTMINRAANPRVAAKPKAGGGIGCRVYVGNLSFRTSSQDLTNYFSHLGEVVHAEVLTETSGQRFSSGRPVSKGCGIVEFSEPEAAQRAIAEMTDSALDGRKIWVREDREAATARAATKPQEFSASSATSTETPARSVLNTPQKVVRPVAPSRRYRG